MAWSRRIRIDSLEKWRAHLRALLEFRIDFRACPVEIVVREEQREKTVSQRRLFHAVCHDVGVQLGYAPGEFKEEVRRVYFGEEDLVERLLAILRGVGEGRFSTEELGAEYYGQLIETAYRIAAEMEIVVPDRRRR